jgi:hypothetical protein
VCGAPFVKGNVRSIVRRHCGASSIADETAAIARGPTDHRSRWHGASPVV